MKCNDRLSCCIDDTNRTDVICKKKNQSFYASAIALECYPKWSSDKFWKVLYHDQLKKRHTFITVDDETLILLQLNERNNRRTSYATSSKAIFALNNGHEVIGLFCRHAGEVAF
jgi:hypothetical protein